jgi:two-component system heavy metal sensor histidine kinase CusS
MREQDADFLAHKVQVLATLLAQEPLNLTGVNQEVLEEAEISSTSPAPFFLRVLDGQGHVVTQTPDMEALLPAASFVPGRWAAGRGGAAPQHFLRASTRVPAANSIQSTWRVDAALDVSAEARLLAEYRRDILIVLVGGLLIATITSAWITRRGLAPIAQIARATERIHVQQLEERIGTRAWPRELVTLANAFDRMLERLQQSFERLSQFSADLAHELRTPINNLMGEAQVALSHPRSASEYVRVLHSALEEYARLARMIDSMLFLAQADQSRAALELVPLDAAAELRAVADFYQAVADEDGKTMVCEGEARLIADPSLLRRAVSNLLSNALKHTPSGGRVSLRAVTADDGRVTLSVVDTGTGVSAEHLSRLGDRFYRVDPARASDPGGAGLGLAIVKSIMQLHGGRLLLDSTPGRGTTASLVFEPESAPQRKLA